MPKLPRAKSPNDLSKRQRQIVQLIVRGKSYPQIAKELELSVESVRTYAKRLRDRTGKRTRLAIALWAINHKHVQKRVSHAS